jgi:hypothetical protein
MGRELDPVTHAVAQLHLRLWQSGDTTARCVTRQWKARLCHVLKTTRTLGRSTALLAACACSQHQATELRGNVDREMMLQATQALADGHRDFTVDSSNGGNVMAAEVIAALIRRHNGSLTVTGRCWSACALMLLGVERKYAVAGADIGIHGAADTTHPADGANAAADYLIKNGLPANIARTWGMGTNLYRLTPAELAAAGVRSKSP